MLKLIPPGKRRGNKHWVARGRLDGKLVEFSTFELDKGAAEKYAAEAQAEIVARRANQVTAKTFKDAAVAYTAWRAPSWREVGLINRLIAELGTLELDKIRQADLVAAADRLCPEHKASSRNRTVIVPAAAILHYAAEQDWCTYRRFKKFKEARPETRALGADDAQKLMKAASGELHTLLVFLFGQGMRISDVLAVNWEQVDLTAGVIEVKIAKTDQYKRKALHPDVRVALAALPEGTGRRGRVFSYRSRWRVYRDLTPLAVACGIYFTPHMARHSLGAWLNASGAGLRTIMDVLDHADPKSSIRYQSTDVAGQRAALDKALRVVGKTEGNDKKAS